MRLTALAMLGAWAGATLLLAEVRWFRRPRLVDRLRPYVPGGEAQDRRWSRSRVLSVESVRDVVAPAAAEIGERLARLVGVREPLARRLERMHSPIDATAFRARQVGRSAGALGAGVVVSVALRLPAGLAILVMVGAPALVFLVVEQRVSEASVRHQHRLHHELPVVAEQLGMLLAAGFSLGAALNRLALRGRGACARDLRRVCGRIRQGLSEVDALREWSALAEVDGLRRLVTILALNREAGDLGRMIANEARAVRAETHRELIATIERRAQQVWIPVTVAALVPGAVFLAVPFLEAMRLFAGS